MSKRVPYEFQLVRSVIQLTDQVENLETIEVMSVKLAVFVKLHTPYKESWAAFADLAKYVSLSKKLRINNDPELELKQVATRLRKKLEGTW